ncbi:MAG: sulfur carrier protein ThiS [Casimicrobiaceae bacterium]
MRVTVNGAARELPTALTLAGLITTLGLEGRRIAVERNGDIVPRSRHAETKLADGDALEIVAAIGGG